MDRHTGHQTALFFLFYVLSLLLRRDTGTFPHRQVDGCAMMVVNVIGTSSLNLTNSIPYIPLLHVGRRM